MPVARHVNFTGLVKACGKPGCPVCGLVSERTARYLDNLLFEHVSDRGFRAAHRASGGFCPAHSRDLASFRDGLAVAILGRDVLEDNLAAFRRGKPPKPKARCPVCAERERIESEFLTFLCGADDGEADAAAELRAAFEASDGLCVPHYGTLLAVARRVPAWLRSFQESRFSELLKRTGSFIELSAYGRQAEFAELPPRDKLVWKELARMLRGGLD